MTSRMFEIKLDSQPEDFLKKCDKLLFERIKKKLNGVQNFIMKKLTPYGINIIENQPEFKRNFGFTVNLGVIAFSRGASEK